MKNDKREHKRYILPQKNQIIITLDSADDKTSVEAVVLNISIGGIGLAASKHGPPVITGHSTMRINTLDDSSKLCFLHGEKVEIRWILEHDAFDNLFLGCRFDGLKKNTLVQLKKFIQECPDQ